MLLNDIVTLQEYQLTFRQLETMNSDLNRPIHLPRHWSYWSTTVAGGLKKNLNETHTTQRRKTFANGLNQMGVYCVPVLVVCYFFLLTSVGVSGTPTQAEIRMSRKVGNDG